MGKDLPSHSRSHRLAIQMPRQECWGPVAKAEFEHIFELGVIRSSSSTWVSALFIVPKRTGNWRPWGGHRTLDNVTNTSPLRRTPYPVFTTNMAGTTTFSKIDSLRASHQIRVAKDHAPKTTINMLFVPFILLGMPFRLRNATQTFQRVKNKVSRKA